MRNRIFLIFCLLISFLAVMPSPLMAQSRALTVIPPKFELFANPGDSLTERIRVRNESDTPVTYGIVIEDFASAGEEGEVTLEGEKGDESFSLASWIEPETRDIILQPGEEKNFSYTINVPRSAEPGGHYASLLFSAGGEAIPGSAAVTQRVGALVLLRVSGNVEENVEIETFETPNYSQNAPVDFTLRLKNGGNVHIRPKGTIIVTDIFNRKVEEIPLNGANVLPNATRKMDTTWDKKNLLGYYTATLVATYGQQNQPLTASTKFLIASPVSLALIAGVAIGVLLIVISLITGRGRLFKAIKVLFSGK